MMFFKPRAKSEDILPPPPPFPSMELEKEDIKPALKEPSIESKLELKPSPAYEVSTAQNDKDAKFKALLNDLHIGTISVKEPPKIKEKPIKIIKLNSVRPTKKHTLKRLKSAIKKQASLKGIKLSKKSKSKKVSDKKLVDTGLEIPDLNIDIKKKEIFNPKTQINFDDFKDFGLGKSQEPKQQFGQSYEMNVNGDLESKEEIQNAIESLKKKEFEMSFEKATINKKQRPSFFKVMFGKRPAHAKPVVKKKQISKPMPPPRAVVKEQPPQIPKIISLDEAQKKIDEARRALMSFDLKTAKRNYLELMHIYNHLSSKDQIKVYQDIKDLYFERKSAEEIKV
jgi:hypothetical protein